MSVRKKKYKGYDVDYKSIIDLGYGPIRVEKALELVDEGKATIQYNQPTKKDDDDDIAPVYTDTNRGGNKDSWFKSGGFSDGVDGVGDFFGDLGETILGTTADLGLGILKGAGRMVEGVTDLVSYGYAGLHDLFGSNDAAEQIRERAKENTVDKWTQGATDFVDQYSVLGNKADMVSEGLGQVGTVILTGGIAGAAGLGTMGATALTTGAVGLSGMGSGMSEAYSSGATDEEAFTYGLIAGVSEAATELIFGGLGKASKAIGVGTSALPLDDILAKKVASKFSSQISKNFAEFGIKAAAEGSEEVMSGILQAVGKKVTYMSDRELAEILEDENLLEQFVVGTVTSGIAQSGYVPAMKNGSLREANKTGRDFITGYTQADQTVVDKLYNDAIKEAEKDGKTLTKKEKGDIYDTIVDNLEHGQLDIEEIESILGEDTYKAYKDTIESEEALKTELKTLQEMKSGEMNDLQATRMNELKAMNLDDTTKREALRKQLNDKVFPLVKDSKLAETYNEGARRGEAFQADLTQYKGKQKEAVERAIKSGVLNNTYKSHKLVDTLSKIEAEKGITFDYTDNKKLKETGFALEGKTVNGFEKNGVVTLNVQSAKAWQSVVGHEITHVLEGTESYNELQKALFAYAESKGELASRKATLTNLYNGMNANIDAELTADLVGDYLFSDSKFINHLTGNRNLFQKVYDEIKYLCKVATGKELTEIEKVKREFDKVWEEFSANESLENEATDSEIDDVNFSVSVTDEKTLNDLNDQIAKGEYNAETNPDGGYYVTYKSMSFWGYDEDGNAILRSPMAEYVDGELSNAYLIPKDKSKLNWYQATETIDEKTGLPSGLMVKVRKEGNKSYTYLPAAENQDLIAEDWSNLYFNLRKKVLKKGKWVNSDVPARYNPYEHSSNSMLNDQFSAAYLRDNLVTVKMYVPISEDNGAFRAKWSKDPTGWADWKTGTVAGKINKQKDLQRKVYLSRYAAPVEIVPDSEVAQAYKEYLEGTDVTIPDNVVSPNLLNELKKAGVPIEESGKVKYSVSQVDGVDYVRAENNIFTKEDGTLASEREVFNSLVGKTIALSDGEVEIVKRLPKKDMYDELYRRQPAYRQGVEDVKQLNSDVNYNMEELLSNSEMKKPNVPDESGRHAEQGITSFDTRTVKFYDGNKAYNIEFSIATLQDGKKVAYAKKFFGYDAELTKKIQTTEGRRFTNTPFNQQSAFNDIISQNSEKSSGNIKYSVSEGNNESELSHYDETSQSYSPVRYSISSWNESDYVTERQKVAEEMANTLGVTEEKASKYIDDVNSIAKMIADDKTRLAYEPSPNRSAFVSNAEYGGSIDFSTICKKRRLFTGTFEAIQNALPNTALTAEEVLEIRKMMKDKGYEVSCGLCYVEGSRANMGQYTKQFIERYKATNPAYVPNMAEMNTATGQEQIRKEHPEVYEAYEYFMNHYGRLSPTDKALFASQQKPKMYQMATEYKGEVLDNFGRQKGSVEEKNKNGGLRLQSFSDFEVIHLIDSMQVIMDMSRVGLAGQAYTKVPDFAWALGDTGLKINLSLIAKGVDENGRLILDEVEGMKESDAMALRDRYSDNVGTILVTFTDEQLRAAMADERIDYIIPYHRSQWKTDQYEMMGLPENTKDYTNLQNESFIDPVYNKNGKKQRPNNYMPNTYWDFTKSGKENAETYLKMCAENNRKPKFSHLLVDNQNGSYSLQPDGSTDGYWKTLIDFKMYNNEGIGVPQNPVVPKFNMDEAKRMLSEYNGGHEKFPVAKDIVEAFVNKHPDTIAPVKYSVSEDIQKNDADYLKAVENGDIETAQRLVNEAAERSGYTTNTEYKIGHHAPVAQIDKEHFTDLDKLQELCDESADLNLYAIANGISLQPDDYFSPNGARWYMYNDADGMESYRAIKPAMDSIQRQMQQYGEVREMPTVKVYRAMPKSLKESKLQSGGQWVTPSYMYAVKHGNNALNGNYKIIEETVSAENLWWDGNDIREWGFDDGTNYAYRDTKNNRKLLDAVTYDNEGNVIPLSKRFNYRNADERYSLSNEDEQPSTVGTPLRDLYYEQDIAPVAEAESVADEAPNLENIAPLPDEELEMGTYERIRPKPVKQPSLTRVKNTEAEPHIAEVMVEEPTVEKGKIKGLSKFRSNFIDKGSAVEDLSLRTKNRALQDKYKSIGRSETKAQYLMENGTEGVKSLDKIRTEVEATGHVKEFYEYLYHKHNVDRMSLEGKEAANLKRLESEMRKHKLLHLKEEQLRAIASEKITKETPAKRVNTLKLVREYLASKDVKNKPVFDFSVTSEISQGAVHQYEAKYPKFKEYAKDVYTYMNHLRKQLVDNGVISQETAELWAEMYPNYVPIRRMGYEGESVNVPLDTNKTGINAPIKRATGGNRDILPLFDTMAQRTIQTYKAIAKNNFGVELKNTLGTELESQKTNIDEVIDSIDTNEELLQEGKKGRNPTFTVFEGGERVTFEITDELYEALKPTSEGLAYTNKALNKMSNIHRGLLTEYNPTFMVTNAIKDAQDILINSQHPTKTYAKLPLAIRELVTKGKWFTEYMENGGGDNTYFDKQTNTFNKDEKSTLKNIIGLPLEKISEANNFIERMPRLAEYIASRESGATIDAAMLDAARVTTDFSAGGDVTKFLNRNGATFLNASVQGFSQQVRNVREAKMNGLKGWVQLATKYAVAGLPALLLNSLLWDDDEEYEELSDYVKDNYYIVAKYGDGKFVRIPKGRTSAVIQEALEQIGNTLTGSPETDWNNFFDLFLTNLAPNNPIDNNILAPIIQVANNETWYGEDLVPSRLQDLPAAEQYDESTDAISKWLGETLNISPYKINYLLNQYGGGVSDVVLPMLTPEAESGDNSFLGNIVAPLKDKFTTDSVMNNQNVSDFYTTKDELAVNANSSKATDDDVLKYKYMNSVNAELSELYKLKREIQNSDISDSRKYEKVRAIQDEINTLAKESLQSYNDVYIEDGYAVVGDREYKLNSNGEWQKITEKQSQTQTDVSEELGISASDYWSDKSEYDFAYKYPDKYAVAKSIGGYSAYKKYNSELYDIKADKDEYGKTITGSRKEKVVNYLSNLDADYETKLILFKSEYPADDTYNAEIIEYLNNREDLTYEEKVSIYTELGFKVSDGYVYWD